MKCSGSDARPGQIILARTPRWSGWALSTVIAVPLAVSAHWLTRANRCLQGAVGAITIAIGATTIYTAFA